MSLPSPVRIPLSRRIAISMLKVALMRDRLWTLLWSDLPIGPVFTQENNAVLVQQADFWRPACFKRRVRELKSDTYLLKEEHFNVLYSSRSVALENHSVTCPKIWHSPSSYFTELCVFIDYDVYIIYRDSFESSTAKVKSYISHQWLTRPTDVPIV